VYEREVDYSVSAQPVISRLLGLKARQGVLKLREQSQFDQVGQSKFGVLVATVDIVMRAS
jgi:hypothetical protein